MEDLRFNETGAEFVIDTDQKAAWAVARINERREQAEYFVEWYEQKIKEINETFSDLNKKSSSVSAFANIVKIYAKLTGLSI